MNSKLHFAIKKVSRCFICFVITLLCIRSSFSFEFHQLLDFFNLGKKYILALSHGFARRRRSMTFDVKIRQLAVNDVLALIGHSVRNHAPKPISKVLQEVALKYKVSSSALRQWTELFINMGHVDVTSDAK